MAPGGDSRRKSPVTSERGGGKTKREKEREREFCFLKERVCVCFLKKRVCFVFFKGERDS